MKPDEALIAYTMRLADNALILSQRMIELVAAAPELEEEPANANFALDFIGPARRPNPTPAATSPARTFTPG